MIARKHLRNLPVHLILIIGALGMIYPLAYSLAASFMTQADYIRVTWFPIPTSLYLGNYETLLQPRMMPYLTSWLGVTLFRMVWYMVWPISIAILAGYVFARLRFKGRDVVFFTLLISLLLPGIVYSIPLYVMLARWPLAGGNDILGQGGSGFIGQMPSLLVQNIVNVLNIFLMRQAFYSIPRDYEEAARLDGANTIQVLRFVYVPMLAPMILVIVIQTFVSVWNDFTWPLMAVSSNRELWPVGLAFQKLIAGSFPIPSLTTAGNAGGLLNMPLLLAAGTLVTLPPVICFFFFQRYFLEGLQGVGVKG